MNFHLGKPILVMIAVALISGVAVSLRPQPRRADLTVWVFADSHYRTFQQIIPNFEKQHNVKVNINLLNGRALALRLGQLFMADSHGDALPDVLEMEIGLVGRFFRPPVNEVGFLPLNDRLKTSGWFDRVVETRFAPWSKEGVIFGVPQDVHPCAIAYREDLFREAGIDLSQARTWPQFQQACVTFQDYWRAKGYKTRHAMELPEASSDLLQVILLQRGINALDSYGKIFLQDPRVAQTMAFYAQMVAGPRKMAVQASSGFGAFSRDLAEGNICAFMTPDWRLTEIKRYGDAVIGKMRLMPLPVFDPSDRPTSTHGGTMMAIPRGCKDPDLAFELVQYLSFSEDALRARQAATDILPAVKDMWADPFYHQPDPFLGGQRGAELYTQLAQNIPPRYVTPFTPVVTLGMTDALVRAVERVKRTGGDDGLEESCRGWLAQTTADLQARMRQWRFDE
jgi:arabinosaccharide transport system substrate-binding protein